MSLCCQIQWQISEIYLRYLGHLISDKYLALMLDMWTQANPLPPGQSISYETTVTPSAAARRWPVVSLGLDSVLLFALRHAGRLAPARIGAPCRIARPLSRLDPIRYVFSGFTYFNVFGTSRNLTSLANIQIRIYNVFGVGWDTKRI